MPFIYKAQYKADRQDSHKDDDRIDWWSSLWKKKQWEKMFPYLPYPHHSHTEHVFPYDFDLAYWIYKNTGVLIPKGHLISFSSASRGDGFIGTRFEDFNKISEHTERWDILAKDVSRTELEAMTDRAKSICGQKYFSIGIFLQLFPIKPVELWLGKALKQWYCSPAVHYVSTSKRTKILPIETTMWALKNGYIWMGHLEDLEVENSMIM